MAIPMVQRRGRSTAAVERVVTLGLLLTTMLVLGRTIPLALSALRNLVVVMSAGLSCLGVPSWAC